MSSDNLLYIDTGDSDSPQITQPIWAIFEPQPDITAYEMALLLPWLLGQPMFEPDWKSLGNARRHLKRTDL